MPLYVEEPISVTPVLLYNETAEEKLPIWKNTLFSKHKSSDTVHIICLPGNEIE